MRYTKIPIDVDAEQWLASAESWKLIMDMGMSHLDWSPGEMGSNTFYINTSEGKMLVSESDYVIKEPFDKERKFYPCKPDIFKKTYNRKE